MHSFFRFSLFFLPSFFTQTYAMSFTPVFLCFTAPSAHHRCSAFILSLSKMCNSLRFWFSLSFPWSAPSGFQVFLISSPSCSAGFFPSDSSYVSVCPMRLCRCVGRFQSVQYCFLWPLWDDGLDTAVFFSFFSPFQASLGTSSSTADCYRSHFSWCHLLLLSCWHGDDQKNGDLCTVCGSCLDNAPLSKQSQQVWGQNRFWSSK